MAQQTGESIWRGFADVARWHGVFLSDNPRRIALRNLGAAAQAGEIRILTDKGRRQGESMADYVMRSTMAARGIVDFVADVAGGKGTPGLRPLNAEETKELRREVAHEEQVAKVRDELRKLGEGVIDPVQGANFFTEKIFYPALRQGGYMAQGLVPVAGLPLLFSSTAGMRIEEFRERGVSPEDAQKMGFITAIPEAAIEFIQDRAIIGKIPGMDRLLDLPADTLKRVALRSVTAFGLNAVNQNLQEALQDITPLLVQHIGAKLSGSIPEVDWNKELPSYGKERFATFWALLPMSLIGTGVATARDIGYLQDARVLQASGFDRETVNAILNAPDQETAQALIVDAWSQQEKRNPDSPEAEAARQEIEDEFAAGTEQIGTGATIARRGLTWTVTTMEGREIGGIFRYKSALDIKTAADLHSTLTASARAESATRERASAIRDDEAGNYEGEASAAGEDWQDEDGAPPLQQPEDGNPFDPLPEGSGRPQRPRASRRAGARELESRGAVEAATMPRTARNFAEAKAAVEPIIGTPIVNLSDGREAVVTRQNLKKMLSAKAVQKSVSPQAQAHAVANIDRLFENAELGESHEDRKGTGLAAVHRYAAAMIYEGQPLGVKITVKEHTGDGGNRIYTVEAIDVEKEKPTESAASGVEHTASSGESQNPDREEPDTVLSAGFGSKVREMVARVKSAMQGTAEGDAAGKEVQGAPLQPEHANQATINYGRPPSVRPGAGVNAPETIAAFADIVGALRSRGRRWGGNSAFDRTRRFLRIGKFRNKALGVYFIRTKIARIRTANDVTVAAHELAHALDDALFGFGHWPDTPTGETKALGAPISVSTPADGTPDLLNAIEGLGGITSPKSLKNPGGEYNGFADAFGKGAARLLVRRNRGRTVDVLVDELAALGYDFHSKEGTPDFGAFYRAVAKAVETRRKLAEAKKTAEREAKEEERKLKELEKQEAKIAKTHQNKPELKDLYQLGYDLYKSKKPHGGYISEGFAEYMRLHLTDPEKAAEKAPHFDKFWKEQVLAKPENKAMAGAVTRAQRMGTTWFRQGAIERAQQQIAPRKTALQKLKETRLTDTRTKFEKAMIEAAVYLRDFVREAAEKQGKAIDAELDPMLTLTTRRLTGDAKADYMANHGMLDFYGNVVGGPLKDAFAMVGPARAEEFILYLWARRALALWHDPRGERDPGMDIEDAEYIQNHYDSPEFAAAAQKVYDWNAGVLNYAAQASPAYKKAVEAIRDRDPGNYIPLFREFESLDQRYAGHRGGVRGKDLVKRLKGSGRHIKPPVESMIAQAKAIIVRADQLHVLEQAIDLAESVPGLGHMINEVPRDMVPTLGPTVREGIRLINKKLEELGGTLQLDPAAQDALEEIGDEHLSFFAPAVIPPNGEYGYIPMWRDGKIRWYEIERGLYETLKCMDAQPHWGILQNPVGGLLRANAKAARLGTTALNASFALVTNPTRDLRTLFLNTRAHRNYPVVLGNWIGAMLNLAVNGTGHVFGKNWRAENIFVKYKDVFDRLGLEMSQSMTQDAAPLARASRRVMRGGKMSFNPVKADTWKDGYDLVLHVFQFGEAAARVAEMKMVAENMGWDPSQPMTPCVALALADAAKTVTTDFTRAGTLAREWNSIVPFFNAAIQGKVSHWEAIKRDPVGWLFKRGMVLTGMAVANWWRNKDEDWWRNMSEASRKGFDFVMIGDEIIRIPRAFDVDNLFMGLPVALLDAWYLEQPERVTAWFSGTLDDWTMADSALPPLVEEVMQQLANRDFYFNSPIVPRRELDRPEEEQYNEYTTRVAIEAGNILGYSPRKIDHAIRSLFGGVGADVAAIFGRGDGYTGGPGDREGELADLPVIGRIFLRGALPPNPVSVEKLYDAYHAANERGNSIRREETLDERNERLALADAARAVSAVSALKSLTASKDERRHLSSLQISIAEQAIAALKQGTILEKRGDFKQAKADADMRARELREAKAAVR